ncbi:MAG: DEAD/DEAH box helicase [Candidatus Heimdallarchaeota archaeon]|nr:DEAD/DEAH box helicase [Candidatus Heimdallarchaeota archaeon]MCK5048302.1 DEAD/DEAH box helicase [Candidatus Heimdallarchaeota archaeon]
MRVPKSYNIVLSRWDERKLSFDFFVFHEKVRLDKRSPISEARIQFSYYPGEDGVSRLRPYKFFEKVRGITNFLKPDRATYLFKGAKKILVSKGDEPSKSHRAAFLDYLQTFKAPSPLVIPICHFCINNHLRITLLKPEETYKVGPRSACETCSFEKLSLEIKKQGLFLSRASEAFFKRKLRQAKDIDAVTYDLFDNAPTRSEKSFSGEGKSSLFDMVEAVSPEEAPRLISTIRMPKILKEHYPKVGLTSLLPIQEKCIDEGLLEGENQLVIAGTSSGKTFVGELAGVPRVLTGKGKFIFLCPLVALANQKYEVFKKIYSPLGLKVAIRVGMSRIDVGEDDDMIIDGNFSRADIIVGTYEAFDWIFRSQLTSQLGEIGTIVIDEIQLLGDKDRGFRVDGIISRSRFLFPKAQILFLSATIGNPRELTRELGVKLVQYEHRPIPLERHIHFVEKEQSKVPIISSLIRNEWKRPRDKHPYQTILFTSTRRRCTELSQELNRQRIRSAYYHAGMTYRSRKKIEERFMNGDFHVVVTTAALGAGVDFPASQVIFEMPGMGSRWLTVAEFEQMSGRAGRFGFHKRGKVVLVIEPEGKMFQAQEKTEDVICFELLTQEVEPVEGEVVFDQESENLLATVCSSPSGGVSFVELSRAYKLMFLSSVQIKTITEKLMIQGMLKAKNKRVTPTSLGIATSSSFLPPSKASRIANELKKRKPLDIAVELVPFEAVYLNSKLYAAVERALKIHMSSRLFSSSVLDILMGGSVRLDSIDEWIMRVLQKWTQEIFTCRHKENPFCNCGVLNLSKLIAELRMSGMNPSKLTLELRNRWQLTAYPGDLLRWLDELIHQLDAVRKLAKVVGDQEKQQEANMLASELERPRSKRKKKQQKKRKQNIKN